MDKNLVPPPTAVNSSTVDVRKESEELPGLDENGSTSLPDVKKLTPIDSYEQDVKTSFYQRLKNVFQVFTSLLSFRFPIQQPPINFFRPHDHTTTGRRESHLGDSKHRAEVLELKVNFVDDLFDRYREVIEERMDGKTMMSEKRLDEIQLGDFVGWTRPVLVRLRALFQIFDRAGDGLVDYHEFAGTLDEYGDETSEEERKHYFQAADVESIGIDFEKFLKMMYNLTMKGVGTTSDSHRVYFSSNAMTRGNSNPASDADDPAELNLSSLGNSLRQIDRNMSRIKSLDVVQQLQAGLF